MTSPEPPPAPLASRPPPRGIARWIPATGWLRRCVDGGTKSFQSEPHSRDYILFYECFHGDKGAGLGASHPSGWTRLVANTMRLTGLLDAEPSLKGGKQATFNNSKS